MKKALLSILFIFSLVSCNQPKVKIEGVDESIKNPAKTNPTAPTVKVSVTNVDIISNQLVITGSNLETATSVRVTGPSGFDESFAIESQSSTSLVANGLNNILMAVNGVFSLIVSNAEGASTYTITFDLQDGQVTAAKLSDMGAVAGEVLTYDGTNWGPAPLTGLSYKGTFDATAGDQRTVAEAAGHYYIVSTPGTNDPDGTSNGNTFSSGDWAVFNGATSSWDVVIGSNNVVSVAGKTGVVTLTWGDITKTGSLLSDIANVDVTGRVDGDILVWDNAGSEWIVQPQPTDTNTNAGTLCNAGEYLDGDGTCKTVPVDTNTNAATLCSAGEYLDGDGTCKTAAATDTNAGTLCNSGEFLNGDGACQTIPVDTDTDTTAGTLCSAGEYLDGDGTCKTMPTPTTSLGVDAITSGAGLYFGYQPNGGACTNGQVLEWNGAQGWVCGTKTVNTTLTLDTTNTLGTSDTVVPSQNAVKTYVDSATGALNSSQWTTSGSDIYYNSGAVGIGVIAPNSQLQVSATSGNLFNLDANTVSRFNVGFGGDTTIFANNGGAALSITNNSGTGDLLVVETSKFVIDADGDVGIGTATPSRTLEVRAPTNIPAARFSYLSGSAGIELMGNSLSGDYINFGDTAGNTNNGFISYNNSTAATRPNTMSFGTSQTTRLLIDNTGNIGVGTVSPSVRLHVADTASDNVAMRFQDDDKNWFLSSSTNEGFGFYENSTGTTPPLFMEVGGNVGIGITNPTQKLTVAGNINVTTGNDICIDGSGCLSAAVSGSGETNTAANTGAGSQVFKDKTTTQLNFRSLTSSDSSLTLTQNADDINLAVNSVGVDLVANGAGLYFDYRPNNVACTEDQVLQYDATNFRWECGAKTVDTDTTYSAGNGIDATSIAGGTVGIDLVANTALSFSVGALDSEWKVNGSDIYYSGGNIGFGTTTPTGGETGTGSRYMELTSGNGSVEFNLNHTGNSTGHRAALSFSSRGTRVGFIRTEKSTTSAIDGDLAFGTSDGTTLSEKMRIEQTGHVGIGITNPRSILHVREINAKPNFTAANNGDGSISQGMYGLELLLDGNQTSGSQRYGMGIKFMAGDNNLTTESEKFVAGIFPAATESYLDDTHGGTALEFYVTENTPGINNVPNLSMIINQDGNVGIGNITGPNEKLTVEGNLALREGSAPSQTNAYGKLYVKSSDSKLYFLDDSGNEYDLLNGSGSGNTAIGNNWISNDGDAEGIYILADGKVGVGMNNPSQALEVTGTIKATAGSVWSSDASTGTTRSFLLENYDDSANQNGVDMAAKLGGTEFQALSWTQDTAWTSGSAAADKDASLSFGVLKDNVATTGMVLTSEGFLGLGKSNPGIVLDVKSDNAMAGRFVREGLSADAGIKGVLTMIHSISDGPGVDGIGASLSLSGETKTEGANEVIGQLRAVATDATAGSLNSDIKLVPMSASVAQASAFVLKNDGKLGLGTTNPAGIIHAATIGVGSEITAEHDDTGGNAAIYSEFQTRAAGTKKWSMGSIGDSHTTSSKKNNFYIYQYTDQNDTSVGKMRLTINDSGYIGMGEESEPETNFHLTSTGNVLSMVESSDNMATQIRLKSDNTSNRRIIALDSSGVVDSQINLGDDGSMIFAGETTTNDVRMSILSSGNVGVGTLTPDGKFEVESNIGARTNHFMIDPNLDTVHGVDLLFRSENNNNEVEEMAKIRFDKVSGSDGLEEGSISFHTRKSGSTNLSNAMVINEDGNVGIGTSAPQNRLHVSGSNAIRIAARIENIDTSAGSATDLAFVGTGTDLVSGGTAKFVSGKDQQWTATGTTRDGFLAIHTKEDDSMTEKMRVTSAGNVGIGTTSPGSELEVKKTIVGGATSIKVENPDTSGGSMAEFNGTSGSSYLVHQTYGGSGGYAYSISNAGNGYTLGTYAASPVILSSNSTERMRIDSSGNVGIGTSTPTSRLTLDDAGVGFTSLNISNTTQSKNWFLTNTGAGDFTINESNLAGTELIIESSTGNLGIGTGAPDQKLSVNGNASKTGGTAWAVFSDARLKTVTRKFDRGLASLRGLDPVFFHYNEDNPLGIEYTEEQVGFVAQEVEKVVPEAVTMMDSGYLQLQSDAILWTMLNSIKELDLLFGDQVNENVAMLERFKGIEAKVEENSREIASLKEENTALKEKVESLEERLKLLENAILKK